ncbi:MAG: tyrosine-type recombinase/integrase [Bacteroidales bacterium]|nr:tyrosine-type recombinase/integrase [Bacteroidales bacterium]
MEISNTSNDRYPKLENKSLYELLVRFDKEGFSRTNGRRVPFRALFPMFEASLGELAPTIRTAEDFNAKTFLVQAAFIREQLASCPPEKMKELNLFCSVVPTFYRYIQKVLGHSVFADGAAVTPFLLSGTLLSRFLHKGAMFMVWTPYLEYVPGCSFYVVTVYGMNQISTRMKAVDYVTINLSSVDERYRRMFFRYILSSPPRIVKDHLVHQVNPLNTLLNEYLSLKREPGYPNPDPKEMTNAEMDHLRNYIIGHHVSPHRGNAILQLFKDAVGWAIDNGYVRGNRSHLRRLRYAKGRAKTSTAAIPVNHFNILVGRLRELATKNGHMACCYVAMRMLAVTRLRISELCSLRKDCLRQTADNGVWQVVGPSKTSGSGKNRTTVSASEYRAIEALSSYTEPLRPLIADRPDQDYLFIYQSRCGIRVLDGQSFARVMRKTCEELGIPRYQPHHIRSCRMTRAFHFAEKFGLSKQDRELLTSHKDPDTTINHYVSISEGDYYAALYGVMTEDVQRDVSGRVEEEMPAGSEPAAGDGALLGACGQPDICTAKTLLPCLTCKSFVTDIHHLSLFKQAVEDIDRRIAEATVEHDREDLLRIKEIYVVYIQRINEICLKNKRKK